jgi:hypothetical protein
LPVSVPTVTSLKRQRFRLDRQRLSANRVIIAMRDRGLALRVSREKSGDHAWLTEGNGVAANGAKLAVAHPSNIVGVGDGLFCGVPG